MKPQVICLPGGVAPAAQRYAPLVAAVGADAELHLKDLEVYRRDAPPDDYSIDLELQGIDSFAASLGLDRFHLVGYSGGGFASLAYAGTRPKRLLSLSLFEPAMVPGRMSAEEQASSDALNAKLHGLTGTEFMSSFVREQVKPGVELPSPAGPVGPEMQKRPAGIAAMMRVFAELDFDRSSLRAGGFPVYYGYGDMSDDIQEVKAGVLARLFGEIRIERYPGVHHFVPPAQIYTPAHAKALLENWRRGEAAASAAELPLQE
jgi:pimeloyl-ACP methyl ester carboxylesterase